MGNRPSASCIRMDTTLRSPTYFGLVRLQPYLKRKRSKPMKFTEPEDENVFQTGTSVSDSKAWIYSLSRQVRDIVREWKTPSPRVEITAAPLEVQELWSRRHNAI